MVKNKTLAAWLSFCGGPLGLHRFYLYGLSDWLGWLFPIPTALGLYGLQRVQLLGLDDQWSWVLIPLLGFTIAACALTGIVYGLSSTEQWNRKFNPTLDSEAQCGQTNWLTVGAVVTSLFLGATVLMGSIVFSFQRYFEYQIEESRKISQ
jgi:hypothetical protein